MSTYGCRVMWGIACLVVATAMAPSGAMAHDKEFETTLTIKDKGSKFTGRVKSDSEDCTKKRLVIVYSAGGQRTRALQLWAVTAPTRSGKWNVNDMRRANGDGGYYAEVGGEGRSSAATTSTPACSTARPPRRSLRCAAGGETAKTKLRMKMQCDDGTCEKARALTSGSFTGKVRSSASDCVDGRTIKVIRKGVSPGPIDSVDAAANGKWALESDDLLPGTYLAKAGKSTEGGTKCKPAKSKKWTLEFNRR